MIGRAMFTPSIIGLLLAGSALADGGKSVPGRCLATVDGKKVESGPCMIRLEPGGGFAFPMERASDEPAFSVAVDKVVGTATARWIRFDHAASKSVTSTLGPLRQDGACWTGARVRLCAWSGEAEMLRNRNAPYTAFHTLLGKEVQGNCHMGGCEWFRFDQATVVAHDDHEVLLRIEGETWNESNPDLDADPDYKKRHPKEDVGTGPYYYRCSRTRPASLEDHGPKGWRPQAYAPDGDTGGSGASLQVNLMYAAACEGLEHPIVDPEGSRLGYDTPGDEALRPLLPSLEDALR